MFQIGILKRRLTLSTHIPLLLGELEVYFTGTVNTTRVPSS